MKSDEDKTKKKTIVVRKKDEDKDQKVVVIPKESSNITPLAGPMAVDTSGADETKKIINEAKKDNAVIVKEKPKELNPLAVPGVHAINKENKLENGNVIVVQDKPVDPKPLSTPIAERKKYNKDKVIEAGDDQKDLKPLSGPTVLMTGVMAESKLEKENSEKKEKKEDRKSISEDANKCIIAGNNKDSIIANNADKSKSTNNTDKHTATSNTDKHTATSNIEKVTAASNTDKHTATSNTEKVTAASNTDKQDDKKKTDQTVTESSNKTGKTVAAAAGIAAVGTAIAVDKKNDSHVKIDETKNKNHDMNMFVPTKLENPVSDSLLHDLRRNGSIECEGFFFKKRMFFFCFWTEKYFVLLKTGQLLWLEDDGSGVGYGNWNIKQATAFNKLDYEGSSHPNRLCFSTGESTGYFAFDSEEARDFWFETLQEVSRG